MAFQRSCMRELDYKEAEHDRFQRDAPLWDRGVGGALISLMAHYNQIFLVPVLNIHRKTDAEAETVLQPTH